MPLFSWILHLFIGHTKTHIFWPVEIWGLLQGFEGKRGGGGGFCAGWAVPCKAASSGKMLTDSSDREEIPPQTAVESLHLLAKIPQRIWGFKLPSFIRLCICASLQFSGSYPLPISGLTLCEKLREPGNSYCVVIQKMTRLNFNLAFPRLGPVAMRDNDFFHG